MRRVSIWIAKRAAAFAAPLAFLSPASAAEEVVNDLLREPRVRGALERAFGDRLPALTRALVDPRIKRGRDSCIVQRHGGYRFAVCGRYSDPYGTGYLVVSEDARQYIAGFVHNGIYTIRASDDWARTQPAFVSDLLKRFSETLPIGIIGKING